MHSVEGGYKEDRLTKGTVDQCAHTWVPGSEGACEVVESDPHVLEKAESECRRWLIERDSVC